MVGETLKRLAVLEGDLISSATKDEIAQIIRSRKRDKAPGHDSITNTALPKLPDPILDHLAVIANAILRLDHFPLSWKHVHVVAIPKRDKDPLFPQCYRPIALISSLLKIIEAVILSKLNEELLVHNIIQDE